MRLPLLPSLSVLLLLVAAPPARADEPPSPEVVAKAHDTYQAGVAAFEAQLYKDAEQAFRDVYNAIHSGELRFDIALALEKQRKWGAAADEYQLYLTESRKVKDRGRIEKRVAELRGRQQRQEELDAAIHAGGAPGEVAARPGNQVLPLADDQALLEFDPSPAPPAAEAQADRGDRPIWKRWWLWVAVGGAVVAGAVVAIVVAGSRSSAESNTFPDIGPAAALVRF